MLGEDHESFEIAVGERLAGHAMSKKKPADDAPPSVKRHNNFGSKSIERATQQDALRLIGSLRKIGAIDKMRVQFEPANQWIAFSKFELVRFRQTAQPRAQSIAIALPDARKDPHARNDGCIRHSFDDTGQKCVDIIEAAEDAWKTQHRQQGRA